MGACGTSNRAKLTFTANRMLLRTSQRRRSAFCSLSNLTLRSRLAFGRAAPIHAVICFLAFAIAHPEFLTPRKLEEAGLAGAPVAPAKDGEAASVTPCRLEWRYRHPRTYRRAPPVGGSMYSAASCQRGANHVVK